MDVDNQKLKPLSEAKGAVRWAREVLKMFDLDTQDHLEYVRHYLVLHLAKMYLHLDYLDNVAITEVGDEVHTKIYLESRKNGCCGRYDELLILGSKLYLIGGNFGH